MDAVPPLGAIVPKLIELEYYGSRRRCCKQITTLSIIFMTHRCPVCQIALPVVVHFNASYTIPGKACTVKVVHELVILP